MRSVAFLVAVTLVGGCSLALDFDSRPEGDLLPDGSTRPPGPGDDAAIDPRDSAVNPDKAAGDAKVDAPQDCSLGTGKGPAFVRIVVNGAAYCIDETEVTNTQYRAFLAMNVPVAPQTAPGCTANVLWEPQGASGASM